MFIARVALIEPYGGDSHLIWAKGIQHFSTHTIDLFALKGKHWKWRMQSSAIPLSEQVIAYYQNTLHKPDWYLVSSMIDLALFQSLLPKHLRDGVNFICYFHENQFAYPFSKMDTDTVFFRDSHYAFLNYKNALVADQNWFNSQYNLSTFLSGAEVLLKQMPDHKSLHTLGQIAKKSTVVYPGVYAENTLEKQNREKIILWNHRMEHDKNPEFFFELCQALQGSEEAFKLVILGSSNSSVYNKAFKSKIMKTFSKELIHWDYVEDKKTYFSWLKKCKVVVSTSNHEFFGMSVMEAILAGCFPILPNRLSYPELIPRSISKHVLYEDKNQALSMLKMALNNSFEKERFILMDHMKQFSWPQSIVAYDKRLNPKQKL